MLSVSNRVFRPQESLVPTIQFDGSLRKWHRFYLSIFLYLHRFTVRNEINLRVLLSGEVQ